MKEKERILDDGRRLRPHDGHTEWSVCGKCGHQIDWAGNLVCDQDDDDDSCPYCGSDDTAWLEAVS